MPKTALEQALRFLQYRPRTIAELTTKLRDKKYPDDEITLVISRLTKLGLVDDARFAKNYAESRSTIYRRGRHRIALELLQKGLPKDLIATAVATIDPVEELASARSLMQSRARQWQGLDPLARKRRAVGLLQRRGFSATVIRQVVFAKD